MLKSGMVLTIPILKYQYWYYGIVPLYIKGTIPICDTNLNTKNMNKENKKQFEALYIKNKLEKYPSFVGRDNCIPSPDLKENGANALTRLVIQYIEFNNGQAERISNTGTYRDGKKQVTDCIGRVRTIGSGIWTKGTGTNGTADISATIRGRSVKIEIKWQKDKQSDDQISYEQSITKAGGIYIIIKTFDQFVDWFKNFESTYLF